MDNVTRISLTIPKNLIEQLDAKTPNRSAFITKILTNALEGEKTGLIRLKINKRETVKRFLDPTNRFLINFDSIPPIVAANIEQDPVNGPKINLVCNKNGLAIFLEIDFSPLKNDSEIITDSEDWLKINEIYDVNGEFVEKLIKKGVLIVDKISL